MNAPSAHHLASLIALAAATVESLRHEHGQIMDAETEVLEALDDEGLDVRAVLRQMFLAQQSAKTGAEAIQTMIDHLETRLARFKRNEERWRETLRAAMETLGLTKHEDPVFGLNLRDGVGKIHITDEAALPDDVVHTITTRAPDRAAIRQLLTDGKDVPGATFGNSPSVLTIRSK